jgi:acetoin utilization protein AcuB
MIASELINHTIPFLKSTDSIQKGIEFMEDNHLAQMVLADEQVYKGILNLDNLEEVDHSEKLLADVQPDLIQTYATINQHIMEVLQIVQVNDLKVVAVLDNDLKFAGSISASDLLFQFAKTLGMQENGAIVVLAINELDYSMAEIARHVESNNVKIISSFYSTNSEEFNFKNTLTLKLNRKQINNVVATLARFGYDVLATYSNDPLDNSEKENYDMLIKYLEI